MTLTHLDVLKLEYPDGDYPPCAECRQWDGMVWRYKNNMLFGWDPVANQPRPLSESGEQGMLQFLIDNPDARASREEWLLVCPGCRDKRAADRQRRLNKTSGVTSDKITGAEAHSRAISAYGGQCFLCESDEDLQLRADHPDFWRSQGLGRNPGADMRTKRARRLMEMGFPPDVARVWCGSCARRWGGKTNDYKELDALKRLMTLCEGDQSLLSWLR